MEGWVKLYRKSFEHWLYNEKRPHTRREAWEDMLLLCAHEDKKVLIEGELIDCKRGQSVMSLSSWGKKFNWSVQQVRTFFELLKKDSMINTEGLRKTTRITICNYEHYQNNQQTDNTEKHIEPTGRQQTNNIKQEDKERKEELFAQFWDLYGKKVDKERTVKLWMKLSISDMDNIIKYIPEYVKSKPERQFRKDPATFLGNKSWNNDLLYSETNNGQKRKLPPITNLIGHE